MNRTTVIAIISFFASVASAKEAADSTSTIITRLNSAESQMWQMTPATFSNPALKQWMLPVSISAVEASYFRNTLNRAVYPQAGEGSSGWKAGAESYMKHRSSTIWGTAFYVNSQQRNPVWNESSDLSLIYPYVAADSIGGDMKSESYLLAGGYADHTDRWAWGATISYSAGLHFRNVDPRPRNVTGQLHITAGGAWAIPSIQYRIGASIGYMKYKQSADIKFVNEMADNSIWHLTGLGTHYERFAGQGYSHSYDGNRFEASLNLLPTQKRGLVATAGVQHFSFDHILTSLNRLPLQSVAETKWQFEAAWLQPGETHDMAATLSFETTSRRGTENIFGDASAGIYPQIDRLAMYRNSVQQASLRLLWQYKPQGATTISLEPAATYSRSRQSYAEPRRLMQIGSASASLKATGRHTFNRQWSAMVHLGGSISNPLNCNINFERDASAPLGMQLAELSLYNTLTHRHWTASASASVARAINSRVALMLSAAYTRRAYASSIHGNDLNLSLSLIF